MRKAVEICGVVLLILAGIYTLWIVMRVDAEIHRVENESEKLEFKSKWRRR